MKYGCLFLLGIYFCGGTCLGQNTPIPAYPEGKDLDGNNTIRPFSLKDKKVIGFFSIFDTSHYEVAELNKYLYNQKNIDAFQSFSFQTFDHNNTYINAEITSFLFGPVRMGVGGSFKTTGDSTKDNAARSNLQNIISNNGDVSFNFSLPIYFTYNENASVHFGVFAQSNFGFTPNLSGASNYSTNTLFTNRSGLNFHFDAGSNGDAKARISLDFPLTYVCGSQNTYDQLGLRDYSVIQVQAGIVIKDLINLHVSGPLWSSSNRVQSSPFTIYLQLSPSQILKSTKESEAKAN